MSPKKTSNKKPARTQGPKARGRAAAGRDVATRKRASLAAAQRAHEQIGKVSVKPDEMPSEVLEFIQAIDDYKRIASRPFPNWSEVLEVVKGLGYEQRNAG